MFSVLLNVGKESRAEISHVGMPMVMRYIDTIAIQRKDALLERGHALDKCVSINGLNLTGLM